MLCLVVLNYILVRCPWLITTKETIQPIQPNWLLCFFCDDGTCRKTLNLGLPRTNPASSSNGRLQNSPYFCVFKYAWAVKQKVWNEAENRERDWGETLKIRFFSLASHALRACEARALRARKTLTPRFTDFFTDFEKKPTVLQSTQTGIILGASRLQFQRSAQPCCFTESKIDYGYKEIVCKIALVTSSVMYGGSEPYTKIRSI